MASMTRLPVSLFGRCGLIGVTLLGACGGRSSPAAPTPITIRAQGSLSIPISFTTDFDRGVIAPARDDVDVWLEAETWTEMYWTAVNGARLGVVGTVAPGRAGCAAAAMQPGRLPLEALSAGLYVCVRTNEGRYAQVLVQQMPGPQPAPGEPAPTLSIEFTTYESGG